MAEVVSPPRTNTARSARSARGGSIALGLLPAPGIAEEIAGMLAGELPGLLSRSVDNSAFWHVDVVCDPLTGSDLDAPRILDVCSEWVLQRGWDFAIALTDLPIRSAGQLVVAEVSTKRRVAGISLPALGTLWVRRRALKAALQLVTELVAGSAGRGRADGGGGGASSSFCSPRPRHLTGNRFAGLVAPVRRMTPADDDAMQNLDVDVRFVSPMRRGHLRLLAGMVRANRPLKLIPSFRGGIVAAFATGAYSLVFHTIWKLADAIGWPRLVALVGVSVVGLIVWTIILHNLWEMPADRAAKGRARLYNTVTAITLAVSVLTGHAVLFVLLLLAAAIFVPPDLLQATLQHPIAWSDYATLVWVAASVGTIAGGLVVGVQDEEVVREAAFSYRQRHRHEVGDDSGGG